MKIYADKGKHEALLQKDRDRKNVACQMKKFTQNDVEMAMRQGKEKIKKLVQRQKAKEREKKDANHVLECTVDNAVRKSRKAQKIIKTEYAQLKINVKALTKKLVATRKVTSSPIESSSNQSSPNLTTTDATRTPVSKQIWKVLTPRTKPFTKTSTSADGLSQQFRDEIGFNTSKKFQPKSMEKSKLCKYVEQFFNHPDITKICLKIKKWLQIHLYSYKL